MCATVAAVVVQGMVPDTCEIVAREVMRLVGVVKVIQKVRYPDLDHVSKRHLIPNHA